MSPIKRTYLSGFLLTITAIQYLCGDNWDFDFTEKTYDHSHFEFVEAPVWAETGLKSESPFIFSVATGPGDFEVILSFAAFAPDESLTVKAESRRLMIHTNAGAPHHQSSFRFVTNVRNPALNNGDQVKLNAREQGVWHWDNKLQIEINGNPPALQSIQVRRIQPQELPTLYLLGDSTVTDQTAEPWIGWGQMLPVFFNSNIIVSNHAESGETLKKFRQERRLQKVMDTLKAGDFVMLQFGHNDMKEKGEGIGAMLSYSDDLRSYISQIRSRGASPILITSMKRRRFDSEGRQYATLEDYPLAVRRIASELDVPMIDLNLMSGVVYSALGPEGSKQAFVHYAANSFPGQLKALKDDSHFNTYGGIQLAKCIVEGIRSFVPNLAKHLKENTPDYDPSTPDPFDSIDIPPSPVTSLSKPDGS